MADTIPVVQKVKDGRILFVDGTKPIFSRSPYCPKCPLNLACKGAENAGGNTFADIQDSKLKLTDKEISEQALCVASGSERC